MASTLPSFLEVVDSACSPGDFVVVVLASLTVDSRFPPLLATVGIGCSVDTSVPWLLVLESLSVALTLSSLPGTLGSG